MNDTLMSGRMAVVVVAAFGLVILATILVAPDTSEPAPAGSTLSTDQDGLAALRALLEESGYDVGQLRRPASAELPPSNATVFVVNAFLEADEVAALEQFVTRGGRLVVVETVPLPFSGPEARGGIDADATHTVLLPHPEFRSVERLDARRARLFTDAGPMVPLYGNESGALVLVRHEPNGGAVFAVANQSVLDNTSIARSDNAALGLALAGDTTRPVLFAEYVHGFVEGAGIPSRWRFALFAIGVAGLVWLFAKSRRFGPATPSLRELPPPRVGYVDALAAGMRKSKQPAAALAPLRAEIERRLAGRTGKPEPSPADLAATAVRLGISEDDVRRALGDGGDTESVMAVGRTLASLNKEPR